MTSKVGILLIGLVMTPYSLAHVGLAIFGVWTFVQSITTYVAVLDPGLGTIANRYAASRNVHQDHTSTARIISLAMSAYLMIGLVLAPVAIAVLPLVARQLHLASNLVNTASSVFLAGFVLFFVGAIADVLIQTLIGLGDLRLTSIIDISGRLTYAVIVIVLLATGYGIWGLVTASFAQVAVSAVWGTLACRQRIGRVLGVPWRLGKDMLRELSIFGGAVQLAGIMRVITLETDPVVIGAVISVPDVGVYNVASSLAGQVQFLPLSLMSATMPAATDAFERGDHGFVQALTFSASRLTALMTLLAGGTVIAVSPLFFKAWLGRSYPNLELIFVLLTVSYIINNFTGVPNSVAVAMGRPGLVARNASLGALASVVATVGLAIPFGLAGIMIGTVIGVLVKVSILLFRFYRVVELPLYRGFFAWLWRLLSATVPPAISVRLLVLVLPRSLWDNRVGAAGWMIVLMALYGAGALIGLKVSGFFEPEDRDTYAQLLPQRVAGLVDTRLVTWLIGRRPVAG